MNHENFTTSFTVERTPDEVFAAITNPRAWWSGEFDGNTRQVGETFTYRYKDLHYSKQQVTELVQGKRVAWRVLESEISFLQDKTEWTGTTITFDVERRDGTTEVKFTHIGITPSVECYDICTDAWTSLIQGSLKRLIVTGQTDLIELTAPAA